MWQVVMNGEGRHPVGRFSGQTALTFKSTMRRRFSAASGCCMVRAPLQLFFGGLTICGLPLVLHQSFDRETVNRRLTDLRGSCTTALNFKE
jgi:hypothetical protein